MSSIAKNFTFSFLFFDVVSCLVSFSFFICLSSSTLSDGWLVEINRTADIYILQTLFSTISQRNRSETKRRKIFRSSIRFAKRTRDRNRTDWSRFDAFLSFNRRVVFFLSLLLVNLFDLCMISTMYPQSSMAPMPQSQSMQQAPPPQQQQPPAPPQTQVQQQQKPTIQKVSVSSSLSIEENFLLSVTR